MAKVKVYNKDGKLIRSKKAIFEKRTVAERVTFVIVFCIFAAYMVTLCYPIVWTFLSSLKTAFRYSEDIAMGLPFAMPQSPLKWVNYIEALIGLEYLNNNFLQMLWNTIWILVTSTLTGLLVGAGFGYVMARFEFKGREVIYAIIIFTMTIPVGGGGTAGLKLILNWNLYDNPLYAIVTSTSGVGMVFMMFYAAFKALPKDYADAVYIDGGGEFTLYYAVMLPFVMPTFMALFIINGIACWNNYQFPMLYLPSYPTLATGLFLGKTEFIRGDGGEPVYYAAILLTALPMCITYIVFSDVIMKNFTVGGLKG